MIEKQNIKISLKKQCALLGICRSSLYYKPIKAGLEDLDIMRKIDEQYLKTPFYGYRRMTACLQREGYAINFKRILRLMRLMGIEAIYQRPKTSKGHPEHKIYPYILKDVLVNLHGLTPVVSAVSTFVCPKVRLDTYAPPTFGRTSSMGSRPWFYALAINGKINLATRLLTYLLEQEGYRVTRIGHHDWENLHTKQDKERYLRRILPPEILK